MADASVDVSEVVSLLDGLKDIDLSDPLAATALDLVAAVSEVFDSQGEKSASGKWPPLSPKYLKRRRTPGPIMQRTGRMSKSVRPKSGPRFAQAATDVDYIKYHLDGGPIIPRRNPFDLAPDTWDRIEATLLDAIADAVAQKAGGAT